jgi:hypothetical protein
MAREDLVITISAVDKASGVFKGMAQSVGAVNKGIQDVSNTARTLNWMFLGQDLIRAARQGVTGLTGLAKASSDVVEAQNFVQQVFGESSTSIIKFSQTATKQTLMSQKAILDTAATFGVFGESAGLAGNDLVGFSTNLIQLAADMASVKNTSVDQAINAIGAAFRNEFTPIRQYGAALDEATLKAEALKLGIYDGTGSLTTQQRVLAVNQLLYQQLGFAIGDVARTQDTFANKQRLLSAQFENFKASIGGTVLPIFSQLMGAAQSTMDVFARLPTPVQNFAVRMAAAGTAAVGLAGGLLLVFSKINQGIKAFNDMRSSMTDWVAAGGQARGAIAGIGKALAGLGAAVVVSELVFATLNDISNVSGKTAQALNQITAATAKMDVEGAVAGFSRLANQMDNTLSLSHLWTDFGKKITVGVGGAKVPIEDLDAAFNKLMESGPGAGAAVLDALAKQNEGLDKNSQQYKDNLQIIQRFTPLVKDATAAQQAQGNEAGLTADQITKYGDAALKASGATDEFQQGIDDANKQMQDWRDALNETDATIESFADKADDFSTAIDTIFTDNQLDNFIKGKDTLQDITDTLTDEDKAVRRGAEGLDINTKSGRDNLKSMEDLKQTIGKDMVQAYKDSGGSVDVARQKMEDWKGVVVDQMKAAGVSQPVIDAYLERLNLTDDTFTSVLKLEGQEEARRKLDELNIDYSKLPPVIYTQVQAAIDRGDYEAAYAIMKGFLEKPVETPVDTTGEDKAAADAHQTVENTMSKPVDQPVTTSNTDRTTTKGWISDLFGKPVNNLITTNNTDRGTTKNTIAGIFAPSINNLITTSNNDRDSTKSNVRGPFSFPINQLITTSNNDAGGTKNGIKNVFATPITQYVQTIFKSAVGVPPGAAAPPPPPPPPSAPLAARPSSAEYAATSAPSAMTMAGVATVPAPVMAGVAAPSSTPSIINLSVNMPMGTNEARVVDLLRSYARSNGRSTVRPFGTN